MVAAVCCYWPLPKVQKNRTVQGAKSHFPVRPRQLLKESKGKSRRKAKGDQGTGNPYLSKYSDTVVSFSSSVQLPSVNNLQQREVSISKVPCRPYSPSSPCKDNNIDFFFLLVCLVQSFTQPSPWSRTTACGTLPGHCWGFKHASPCTLLCTRQCFVLCASPEHQIHDQNHRLSLRPQLYKLLINKSCNPPFNFTSVSVSSSYPGITISKNQTKSFNCRKHNKRFQPTTCVCYI